MCFCQTKDLQQEKTSAGQGDEKGITGAGAKESDSWASETLEGMETGESWC